MGVKVTARVKFFFQVTDETDASLPRTRICDMRF